jgi:hypothetical protein
MPRYTESYNLKDEYERLDAHLDDLAQQVVEIEQEMESADEVGPTLTHRYETRLREFHEAEREIAGISWALNPDDPNQDPITEVTVGALTAGEYVTAKDRTEALRAEHADRWGVDVDAEQSDQLHVAAAGLVDADSLDTDDYDACVDSLADAVPQFLAWLASRVDNLSTPKVEGNDSGGRLADARSRAETESDSPEQS